MEDSIFTKIINGEIPCYKIYEDELTIAFLDINPVQEGHTLVVSKKQIDQFIDLPEEDYDALWKSVKQVSRHLKEKSGKERLGVVIMGIDVPHTHVHLVPFNPGESIFPDPNSGSKDPDHNALAAVASKLKMTD